MKLADIKKLSKKKAKTTNPTGTPSKSVYGGVGLCDHKTETTPAPATGGEGGGDGGGE